MTTSNHLPIFIRAYVENRQKPPRRSSSTRLDRPSRWSVIFDCETTTDPGQALRFGFYQVRDGQKLHEDGVFYDASSLSADDLSSLKNYAARHDLVFRTVRDFIEEVFLKFGFYRRGAIVGFNLPFDISRLAIRHAPARGRPMHGGFSFTLTENTFAPHVRIRHLSRRSALIDFSIPHGPDAAPSRSMRKRGQKRSANRGYFFDAKTLAGALTARSFTLASLCGELGTDTRKHETDEHGGPVTEDYLRYARADVQATWECHCRLLARYAAYGLDVPPHKILSEASIGKACLQKMSVKPLLECQPDFLREMFGRILGAYYGGRAEVRIRREVREVRYCDFKAMYPTVNTLIGLWRFVIGDGLVWRDGTEQARSLLQSVTFEDLQLKHTWRQLTVIARVRPDRDLLPVRAKYDGKSLTIGLNYMTCRDPLWFTLADLLAAKLLTGKTPEIEEAIIFEPGPVQEGLQPVTLLGRDEFNVDPTADDMFRRLVDLRDQADKRHGNAIKIINNSMSYGIAIEINRDDAAKCADLDVYGPTGGRRTRNVAVEEPGTFFNPLLGAIITGAARLMLAVGERLVLDESLEWVFCDTDSLAIARPGDMDRGEFARRVDRVVAWFEALNPYAKPGSILKVEDLNRDPKTGLEVPLYAWAISAKRYALFNVDQNGKPHLRKVSQHGLGHLMPPYEGEIDETRTPNLGVPPWHRHLWQRIVEAALAGTPDRVDLDYHPNFELPALSRYGATTPEQLGWFKTWNEGKPYREQVKPFNFLTVFMEEAFLSPIPDDQAEAIRGKGRPRKRSVSPVAPFHRDPTQAILQAFDRHTGNPVASGILKTYQQALRSYHLSCEGKFENGAFLDRGTTRRRHAVATEVRLIGKEANRVDLDQPGDAPTDYGNLQHTKSLVEMLVVSALRSGTMKPSRRRAEAAQGSNTPRLAKT